MSVIGAGDVDAAAGNGRVLHVRARDLVTPLARERAAELGIEIVTEPGGAGSSGSRSSGSGSSGSGPRGNGPRGNGSRGNGVRGNGVDGAGAPGARPPASGTSGTRSPATTASADGSQAAGSQAAGSRAAGSAAWGAGTPGPGPRPPGSGPPGSGPPGSGAPPPPAPGPRDNRSPGERISGTGSPTSSVPPPRRGPRTPRPSPTGLTPRPPTPPPTPLRPPSGALFRRGAPLAPAVRPGGGRGTGRVAVVGAGNVGMIAAMRLADADRFSEVVLVDIDEGRAKGVALDLTHTAALSGFDTRVRGVGTVEEAGACDYVIVTAGKPRTPGMSRSDLISTNAAIVGDVAGRIARTSPGAVIVVVTNPLDEMTQHAWTVSGFPSERVVGMAGVLDTARFQALTALTGVARADRVQAWALGSHGEEMVIPLSGATADGRPLRDGVPAVELAAIVDRARGSGAEVVGLLRSGSAFMAPGMSAARMVLAMAGDTGEVMPAAVLARGEYGIRDVYVGLPARLGRGGLREIVVLDLAPDELAALRQAAERIRERLAELAAA